MQNYVELKGETRINIDVIKENKRGIPYLYCVHSKKTGNTASDVNFETICKEPDFVEWKRCLKIPPDYQMDNGK